VSAAKCRKIRDTGNDERFAASSDHYMLVQEHMDAQSGVMLHPAVVAEIVFVVSGDRKHSVICAQVRKRGNVLAPCIEDAVYEVAGDDRQIDVEFIRSLDDLSGPRRREQPTDMDP
jgi:hypothetical protein